MEKPLDLSQREDEMDFLPNRDEPICQVANCNCPLKHIMQLESPKAQTDARNMNSVETVSTRFDQYPAFGATSSQYKRFYGDSEYPHADQMHPKRRRIEMYNKSMVRSSSNEDIVSMGTETGSNVNDNTKHTSLATKDRYNSEDTGINVIPQMRFASNGNNSKSDNSTQSVEASNPRERSQSVNASFAHGLPKKRVVRRYSPETINDDKAIASSSRAQKNTTAERTGICPSITSLASVSPHDKFTGGPKMIPTCVTSLPNVAVGPSPSLTNKDKAHDNSDNHTSASESRVPASDNQTLTASGSSGGKSSNYDIKSLKAEMLREIDASNAKGDHEEVKPQRGNIFFSRNNNVSKCRNKAVEENVSPEQSEQKQLQPGDDKKSQSLDYMILTTLMQSEDKPFKARNNHIHEIIRGEKRGKLCLMDLVELQVEMGLA